MPTRFLLVMLMSLACVLPGRAEDPAPAPPAPPEQPAPPAPPVAAKVFVLDVAETLDGKDSGYNYPIFFARKLLEQIGAKAIALKPTHWDKDKKGQKPGEPKKDDDFFEGDGEKPKDPKEPEAKPAPKGDLTIKGSSATKLKDRAVFYEQVVAYTFASQAKFELLGQGGKKLATIEVSDAYGQAKSDREVVSKHCLERMGRKVLLALFRHEAVRALLDKAQLAEVDKVLAGVQDHIDKQDRNKARDGEQPTPPEEGDGQK